MVLDPLSALAVGASVVQFLEFSGKLISKATELYKGSSQALIEVQELYDVSQRLGRLGDDLLTTRRALRSNATQQSLPQAEVALEEVSLECTQIAVEYEATLQELLSSSKRKAWKSCRQAFKSIWNKAGLEAMQRRLSQQREQLVIHLLVVISKNQLESLGDRRRENRRLETHIVDAVTACHTELKDDLARFAATLGQPGRQSISDSAKQKWKGWQKAHKEELLSAFADFSCRMESEKSKQIEDYILSMLSFLQLHDRELRIHPAHAKTFGWVFESSTEQKPFSDFVSWIAGPSTSGRIYWVAGKPGSGKSTLMRFLARDDRTKAFLATWASTKPLLFASWYFWLLGTEIQKSYHGMIRSLLYDLLRQTPSLLPMIFPWRWKMCELRDDRNLPDWTVVELEDALFNFFMTTAHSHRLSLFIDGLDELQGGFRDHSKLVQLMQRISQFTHIKVCVSSRPWPVFQTAFSKGPMLRLETLTYDDIEVYVHDKLSENQEFQSLQNAEIKPCSALVQEVVDKAQGVFLWVYLVVRDLLQGVIEGDTMDELYLRLRKMPEDLDDFFRYIVMGIEHDHRPEAAALFKVVLEINSPTLQSLSFLSQALKDPNFWRDTGKSTTRVLTLRAANEVLDLQASTMARRIESRSKGLLETRFVNEIGDGPTVDFLHLTARDFLLSPSSQDVLGQYYPKDFRPDLFICRAIVAQLHIYGSTVGSGFRGTLGVTFCEHFRKYEAGSKTTDVELMDRFTIILDKQISEYDELKEGGHGSIGSSVYLALLEGIKLYALHKIEHETFDLNTSYSHNFCDRHPSSLLAVCACRPEILFEVAAALLEKGANVDEAWTEFLTHAMSRRDTNPECPEGLNSVWVEMAKLLIEHGAPIKAYQEYVGAGLLDCRPRIKELFPEDGDLLITLLNRKHQSSFHEDTDLVERNSSTKENCPEEDDQPITILNKRYQTRLRRLGSAFKKKFT